MSSRVKLDSLPRWAQEQVEAQLRPAPPSKALETPAPGPAPAAPGHDRPSARATTPPQTMNGLEHAWSSVLFARQMAGEILAWKYASVSFRVGHDCKYTPDFIVVLADGRLELQECKGWMRDDALVKLRACRELYPWLPLRLIRAAKGGAWIEELLP